MKTHAFTRLDIGVSSAGNGWVMLCPSLASDTAFGFYTTSSYAGTAASPLSATSTTNTGVSTFFLNQPFKAASLVTAPNSGAVPPISGRIVSYGVRVQYTGTTTNQSGLMYCFQEPGHNSVSGITPAQLGAEGQTNIEAVTRKPCTLVGHAINDSELNFSLSGENFSSATFLAQSNECYPYNNGVVGFNTAFANNTTVYQYLGPTVGGLDVYVGAPTAIVYIAGAAAGSTFHVEVVAHIEYTGGAASAMETKTESDISGTNKVLAAAKQLPVMKLDRPKADPWELMYSGLKTVWNDSKEYVIPAAISAVTALL